MKARSLLVAPLVLGVALVGACTKAEKPEETPAPTGPAVPATANLDANSQPREALEPGGELRIAVPGLTPSWNPLSIAGSSPELASVREAVFPTLFQTDAEGTPTPNQPFLLSAEQTSDSPTKVTLKLNPKAVWGDGQAITWADVKATAQACNGSHDDFNCATTAGFDQITSVTRGADDFEAVVTFRGTYADWTQPLTTLVRADGVRNATAFNDGWGPMPLAWTAGPFVVAGFDQPSQSLAATPNPRWWGDAPLLERITWRSLTPSQASEAFTAGTIDSWSVTGAPTDLTALADTPDTTVRTALGPQVRMLVFNSSRGPLKDEDVRRGVALALDRSAIATAAETGLDWPALPVNNHVLALSDPGYVDQAEATGLRPDPAVAAQALDQAGWKGTGTRTRKGKQLSLKLAVADGSPAAAAEAEAISAQLQAVGIGVETVRLSGTDQVAGKLAADRDFDLAVVERGPTAYPYALRATWGGKQPGNLSGTADRSIDESVAAIEATTDPTRRTELANAVAKTLWTQARGIPLYQRPEIVTTRGGIANFGALGKASIDWENVGYQQTA